MQRNSAIGWAWQEMRFACVGKPGPLVLPYVQQLREIEEEMANVVPMDEAAKVVLEALFDERIRHVIDACRDA